MTQGYTIETLTPEPILLLTLLAEWDLSAHMGDLLRDWQQALEAAETPLVTIIDVRSPGLAGLEDICLGVNHLCWHAALRETLVVSTHAVLKLMSHGLDTDEISSDHLTICASVERALARAHEAC